MSIETFPQTTPGAAAAAVVEKLGQQPFRSTKWDGGKISTDGVYSDLPIDVYHSDACDGPSISSSGLRTIDIKSPAHYWDSSYLNPNRRPAAHRDSFTFGRAAHMLLLGEEGFARTFAVLPDEFPDFKTKAAREWRDAQVAAGREVLTPKDLDVIKGIANSLAAHPLIMDGLLNGAVEHSIIWKDKETGIWLKSRPDALPVNADIVADLKTSASAGPQDVRRSIWEYGYHMQMALVGMGMEATLGRKLNDEDYVLVFVEKTPPYCINIKPIDPVAIFYGRRQIRRALRKFANCISKNEWPGYEDDGITAGLPKYIVERLEAEIKSGLLPEVA